MLSESQQTLITENIKLAYKNAHYWKNENPSLDKDELESACMYGLTIAGMFFEEGKSEFSTFAYACMRNEVLKIFRSMKKGVETLPLSNEHHSLGYHDKHLFEEQDSIDVIMTNLTVPQKRILEQRFYHEKPVNMIANDLGYTRQHIGRLYNQAVNTARQINDSLELCL